MISFMDWFKKKPASTAQTAKGRLQVIIAQERSECGGPDFLRLMHDELLDVVRKYIDVDPSAVRVQVDKNGTHEVLEVNIVLPDRGDGFDRQTQTQTQTQTQMPPRKPNPPQSKSAPVREGGAGSNLEFVLCGCLCQIHARTTTHSRNMAGARSLWCNRRCRKDFGKP